MKTVLTILLSLSIVCMISGLIGMATWLWGIGFWGAFFISTAAQLIIGALWNTHLENKFDIEREAIKTTNKLANTIQSAELLCAYCSTKNVVDIAISRENTFICNSCNSNNKVQITFNTLRITEPVVKDHVLSQIFEKLQEPLAATAPTENTGDKNE